MIWAIGLSIRILYPLSFVPVGAAKILMLNPMAQIIQDVRYVLVTPSTQTIASLYGSRAIRIAPLVMAIVLVVIAVWYFKSRSKYFAEEV